jgi:hypothetical protein
LAQETGKSADFDLAVQRNNTTFGATAHDDVAPGLTNLLETQALKRSYDFSPGYAG